MTAPALRHGIDVVQVDRLRGVMERSPRFEEEVFTEGERAYCRKRPDPWPHFAARFAAKEATLKALRRGLFGEGVDRALRAVEHEARAAERAGFSSPALSLTHDGGIAMASVVWVEEAAS